MVVVEPRFFDFLFYLEIGLVTGRRSLQRIGNGCADVGWDANLNSVVGLKMEE